MTTALSVVILLGILFVAGGAVDLIPLRRWWHWVLLPLVGVVAIVPIAITVLISYLTWDRLKVMPQLAIALAFVVSLAYTPVVLALQRWSKRQQQRAPRSLRRAEALIQAYGRAWTAASLSGSVVTDVNCLPASKEMIKAALLLGMRIDSDLKGVDLMKSGYLQLARFQPGVGNRRITWQPASIPDDPMALAQALKERMPEYRRWLGVVRQEEEQLSAELSRAGS